MTPDTVTLEPVTLEPVTPEPVTPEPVTPETASAEQAALVVQSLRTGRVLLARLRHHGMAEDCTWVFPPDLLPDHDELDDIPVVHAPVPAPLLAHWIRRQGDVTPPRTQRRSRSQFANNPAGPSGSALSTDLHPAFLPASENVRDHAGSAARSSAGSTASPTAGTDSGVAVENRSGVTLSTADPAPAVETSQAPTTRPQSLINQIPVRQIPGGISVGHITHTSEHASDPARTPSASRAPATEQRAGGRPATGQQVAGSAVGSDTPPAAVIRRWARAHGYQVGLRGRLRADIVHAWHRAN